MRHAVPKTASLHTAILEGIGRCENVSNPAVIKKKTFTVHVRKLPVADGRGWVVRIIDKTSVSERHRENNGEQVNA